MLSVPSTPSFTPVSTPSNTPSLVPTKTNRPPTLSPIPTAPPTVLPQPEVKVELLGQIGGASKALAMRGQHVYLGIGLRLAAIDVSNPSTPHAVGYSEPLPGVVNTVVLAGDHAFTLTEGYGLSVLNISDPAQLQLVASLRLAQPGYGLAVSNSYAYVANGGAGLVILDVSTPEAPRQVGALQTHSEAIAVTVASHFVYVAEGNRSDLSGALEVIDVAHPTAPELIGSLLVPFARAVSVAGDYAFVATYGLRIVEVSDPSHLRLIGSYEWDTAFNDVAVTASYVLISGNRYCDVVAVCPRIVSVLDVSDPTQPRLLDTLSLPPDLAGAGRVMTIQSGRVYIANEVGLQVWEGPPWKTIGEYRTVSRLVDVALANGVAYGVDGERALHIFDVSDPTTPEVVSTFPDLIGSPNQVHWVDDYAILGLWDVGFAIVDVRQPNQPRLMAQIEARGSPLVAVNGRDIYVLHGRVGGSQLSIYSIEDPESPRRLSSLQIHGGGYVWLEIADHYALLGSDGLIEIFDIGNLKWPRKAGELALDPVEQARYPAVAVNGSYIYLIRQSIIKPFPVELLVYELAAPTALRLIAAVTLSQGDNGLTVAADYVYVVGSNGLSVVDISDPTRPHEVGLSAFSGMKLAVSEDHVYVAGGDSGLVILCVNPCLNHGSHAGAWRSRAACPMAVTASTMAESRK